MTKRFASSTFAALAITLAATAPGLAEPAATVGQSNIMFEEKEVHIAAGDAVRFANTDNVAHNILILSGKDFDGALQNPGDYTDVTFEEAGEYLIGCAIHPTMVMKVFAE